MKRFFIYTLICSFATLMGCDKSDEVMNNLPEANGKKVTVTADIQGDAATRVTLTQDNTDPAKPFVKVGWKERDETFEAYAEGETRPIVFTQTADTEDSKNLFEGTLPETPAEYTVYYSKKDYDLSEQDGTLNEAYVLMQATTDFSTTIDFEHKTAILKPTFKVGDAPLAANTITQIVMGGINNPTSTTATGSIAIAPLVALEDIYIFLPTFTNYESGHEFTFAVTAGAQNYEATFTIPAEKSIQAGKFYTATISLSEAAPVVCQLPDGSTFNSVFSSIRTTVTSIVFEANSTKTGGTQIGESSAYYLLDSDTKVLTIYTKAAEFVFNANCYNMFWTFSAATTIDFGENIINTSNVTNMSSMFGNCQKLTTLDLTDFDTSAVINMSSMFNNCQALASLDYSSFNTANVTDMNKMFYNCAKLTALDLKKFNTGKVTNMSGMFNGCSLLASLDLSSFNTENVTNMSGMFYACANLPSLNVSNFNTSEVITMKEMFKACRALTALDLKNFDTSKVTTMNAMFNDCQALTSLDLSSFDTRNVTDMYAMFYQCYKLTPLNITHFVTSKVTTMQYMFYGCNSLESLDLENFNTEKVTDMSGMFKNCSKLTALDLSNFNTSKVTTMKEMFYTCTKLASVNLSSFNTELVTDMRGMFYSCQFLTSPDLSSFNTSKVTTMYQMFYNCTRLTSPNLSSFDTSKVTTMHQMFAFCNLNLTSLDLCNFTFTPSGTTPYKEMFKSCTYLKNVYVKDEADKNKIKKSITSIGNDNYIIVGSCPTHNPSQPM